jgi:hypothetical protein
MDTGGSLPLPLLTIRAAYAELGRSVDVALRTQMGDAARLGVQRVDCLRLLALTEQVCVINDFAVGTVRTDIHVSTVLSFRLKNASS